nr:MAG TPA: hypothetical protein [Caudoviricetes sp.]
MSWSLSFSRAVIIFTMWRVAGLLPMRRSFWLLRTLIPVSWQRCVARMPPGIRKRCYLRPSTTF